MKPTKINIKIKSKSQGIGVKGQKTLKNTVFDLEWRCQDLDFVNDFFIHFGIMSTPSKRYI